MNFGNSAQADESASPCLIDIGLISDRSDDDVVHILLLIGHDQPGDLILGQAAYRRFLEQFRKGVHDFSKIFTEKALRAVRDGNKDSLT